MRENYHYGVIGKKIVCWNGNDGWTEIADIINNRACRHLVRTANAGEDMESLVDRLIADTSSIRPDAPCFEPEDESNELEPRDKCPKCGRKNAIVVNHAFSGLVTERCLYCGFSVEGFPHLPEKE